MTSTIDASIHTVNSPPEEFVCSISMNVMRNPMRSSKTNHCFEREAIMNWIYQGNPLCPLTRTAIHPDDLVLDTELQAKILKWKLGQEMNDSSIGSLGDSDADFEATLQDILEITNRIQTVTINNNSRRKSTPALRVTTPAPEAPQKRNSEGSRRLSDIRSRVLQRRDERIQSILSQQGEDEKPLKPESSSAEKTSLASLMAI